jgi:hypothetical protein
LRSLVREVVSGVDGLEIVGEVDDRSGAERELLELAAVREADFAIVAPQTPEVADIHLQLLARHARMKVLAIANGRDGASLWELQPQWREFVAISPGMLVDAIREADWTVAGAG